MNARIKRALFGHLISTETLPDQGLKVVQIVHKGAKKLRIKANPFGHPLTWECIPEWMSGAVLSRLTIGEVAQCVTRRILVLGWRDNWENDYYRNTEPEVDSVVYPHTSKGLNSQHIENHI